MHTLGIEPMLPRSVHGGRMMAHKLTKEEQQHTTAALHLLHIRFGTWALLSKALGFERSTMKNVLKDVNDVSVNMAYRAAKVAGATFDDVTNQRSVSGAGDVPALRAPGLT
jgi:hypothetical protein